VGLRDHVSALDLKCMVIRCAICEKPVDKVVREPNFCADTTRFTVYCHGDTDTCELTAMQLEEFGPDMEPGYAFTTRRIEGEEHNDRGSGRESGGDCAPADPRLIEYDPTDGS